MVPRGQLAGQAGSGKTALIRYFLQQASAFEPKLAIAAGTCNAQTGIGDPYLPFREALAMLTAEQPAQPAAGALSPKNRSQLRTIVVRSALVLIETAPYLAGTFVPGGKLFGALGKAVASEVGWTDRLDELAIGFLRSEGIIQTMADIDLLIPPSDLDWRSVTRIRYWSRR